MLSERHTASMSTHVVVLGSGVRLRGCHRPSLRGKMRRNSETGFRSPHRDKVVTAILDQGLSTVEKLQDDTVIEQWIADGLSPLVFLAGFGVFDDAGACVRFLHDIEKNSHAQIAWHSLCRAFAGSFAPLRRGETQTRGSVEPGYKF